MRRRGTISTSGGSDASPAAGEAGAGMVTGLRDGWRHQLQLWTAWSLDRGCGVGDEAEAFLGGRLLQQMRRCGWHEWVPPWLWLNAVAHGDRPTVIVVSGLHPGLTYPETTGEHDRDARGWRWAQARVAGELLRRSQGSDETFRALQREVLVPLELTIGVDVTPERMVEFVIEELHRATV
jgi:hypothetical protein